jgi:hypothetical protein
MSWKKYFAVAPHAQNAAPQQAMTNSSGTSSNYSSFLPEVYAGHPNRLQRYYQYDDMDRDSDICAALDTIADFSTQSEEQNDQPLDIKYTDDATETEVMLLKRYLEQWMKLNDFRSRLWYMFRDTIKNGDAFFLRDPETQEWLWLDHYTVEMVRVEDDGTKKPTEYLIRGFDYNREAKFGASRADMSQYRSPFGSANANGTRPMSSATMGSSMTLAGGMRDPRMLRMMNGNNELFVVDADHVVHLSLSVGMDINWPFGQSVLEPIFKTYKQKELLEDSIIIYRVQRAPERRVFYIDVGQMPPSKARAHLDQIKNEIHQRRIPNHSGGGNSMMDAAYNPLSIVEDYFFAQSAEGRGSKVETLPGGENLGEITDLSFFTKKMARGLRIPESYLSLGSDDGGGVAYNDGKLGAAMIQEFRFNKYCMRLQSLLAPKFDSEFKRFLRENGVEIDHSIFQLVFCPPQNFTKYRQIEVDQAQAGVYQMVADNKKLAERFKLKRFLNLSEDELIENETLWKEENAAKLKRATGQSAAETEMDADLSSVGIRPPGGDDLMGMEDMPDGDMPPDDLMGGDPAAPPPGGPGPGMAPPGGAM